MFEWTYRRIRDLLETSYAGEWGAPPSPGNARVLRATDIDSDGRINGQGALRQISPAIVQTKHLQRGDIMLEASGGSPEKPVGRVAFFFDESGELPFLTSNFYKALRPASDVEPRFLHWALLRFYRQPDILQFQQQTTGIINLKFQDYLDAKIYAPVALNEQKLIARILDTLDTQIQTTEALIAKLEKVKEGLLHDLLTRGIDENGQLRPSPEQAPELYKESPLGLIPREWEVRPLKSRASSEITYGIVQAGPHIEGGVPYIRTGDMSGDRLEGKGLLCTSRQVADQYKRSEVMGGDLVISIRATVGKVLPVPESLSGANLTQGTAKISPSSDTDRDYLLWAIRSEAVKNAIDLEVKGSTFKEITLAALREIPVSAPANLIEQRKIGESLVGIDGVIRRESDALMKLKAHKAGLMDDLLAGRVRVTPLLEKAQAITPA
ncbi:restriction endonuclease subunit S [Halomonas sp. PBN3]|uniref:restriction endonuclease subunit S n=1 Tax=Halomonas sp. PBN3 TaxID=1397528 RepID=UPI00228524BE|nr:restriction endonuclease subunit S [Halomonas sp. PBN3]